MEEHYLHSRYVPTTNTTLLADLYGSITDIATYAPDDPIRIGAIAAYQAVMYKLVLGAVVVALIPPVVCMVWTANVRLGRGQNALDGKDLSGRAGSGAVEDEVEAED